MSLCHCLDRQVPVDQGQQEVDSIPDSTDVNCEVKFRPSYLSICQKQDEIYSSQMEKLIKEVNILSNQSFLTSREISETYLSMVDGLWQRILFDPKMYSHVFCKDLIKKYFRNIYADEKRFV